LDNKNVAFDFRIKKFQFFPPILRFKIQILIKRPFLKFSSKVFIKISFSSPALIKEKKFISIIYSCQEKFFSVGLLFSSNAILEPKIWEKKKILKQNLYFNGRFLFGYCRRKKIFLKEIFFLWLIFWSLRVNEIFLYFNLYFVLSDILL